ncbi:MAG: hypothetical protein HY819_24520 [Acidobacteria bacterium]|nr:hypothetical protein [Acidobacteriota bacterium]
MLRAVILLIFVIFFAGQIQAQTPSNNSPSGFFTYNLAKGFNQNTIEPLASDDPFILPKESLAKLQRQANFQLLPTNFFPSTEKEADRFKLKALRYGIAFFRDCEIPGLTGFYDVILGTRLDTRSGKLELRYFRTAIVLNPKVVQIPEDRPAFASLQDADGTVMLFLFEDNKQELVSYEGIFTDDPHATNFLGGDDVIGVSRDELKGKFAIFTRGGVNRSSIFLLLADANLKDIQSVELIKDIPSTDQAFIFEIIPALLANAPIGNKK